MAKKTIPHITGPLPGPKAKQLIEGDKRYMSPSYTRDYPLAVMRGKGATIEDVDGNLFLDFTSGIAVCATGHCHPKVVKAVKEQASKLIHMSGTDFYYRSQRDLAQKLAEITPGRANERVFFTNSGAESVEAAFKLARYNTKRSRMIAFFGAFHGRTMGALSLTGSKVRQRERFEPLVPEVEHVEYGNCYRCPYNLTYPKCNIECIDYIEHTLFKKTIPAEEVAGIIVEPVQGEGGYIVPPDGYHQKLKKLADKYGIVYIVDEVQSGMGRTGKMFAIEHWGVEPDIMCLAKGIASGMPLGAIVARPDIMDWQKGSHASTFGGNPISCAASLATIQLLEEKLVENSRKVGAFIMKRLKKMKKSHRLIGDVRGLGLMIAVELVKDPETKERAVDEREKILQKCFHKGLILLGCGESAIRLCPPLIITRRDASTALAILDEVLTEVE